MGTTMDQVSIGSFAIDFKSARRNVKYAIQLGAMPFALCFSGEASS
jgi:hypothetical protein